MWASRVQELHKVTPNARLVSHMFQGLPWARLSAFRCCGNETLRSSDSVFDGGRMDDKQPEDLQREALRRVPEGLFDLIGPLLEIPF